MKICSIGNQICVAQDLKLYACRVCVCVFIFMYINACEYIYLLNSQISMNLKVCIRWVFFFFHFSDFICEYTEDLLIPSPLVLDVPGVPQFSILLIFVSDFPSPVYYPAFRSSP